MKFLSLGAGVQSTTLLLMMIRGDLPKVDHAIFGDTGGEPEEVYTHLARLQELAAGAGIPVHVVRYHDLEHDTLEGWVHNDNTRVGHSFGTIPFFILNTDGTKGMLNRSCTERYKARPVERKMKELLGVESFAQVPAGSVQQYFGISRDEVQRMRVSSKKAIKYYYPLIMLNSTSDTPLQWREPGLRREHCLAYCKEHFNIIPPKSACYFCPYHSNAAWREIRKDAKLWARAVAFDKAIRRSAGLKGQAFLHADRIPLDQVNLDGEVNQWGLNLECEGLCGL